jgi:hypothetical protein
MRIQLLSDLHLETEHFDPAPAAGADVLVLAGDIDATWDGYARFTGWPVPVLVVAGNHEFDGRDIDAAQRDLAELCRRAGWTQLERQSVVLAAADGQRVRFCGSVRWSDFDLFGPAGRARALRAGQYFQRVMKATRHGAPFDAPAVRDEALRCRHWLAAELVDPAQGRWDATVTITHFAPSLRSNDPRFGAQPGTASFCNADDDLLALPDLWLHGHLHCRHDYRVSHADGTDTRVVCQARGLERKGEAAGYDPFKLIEVVSRRAASASASQPAPPAP